MPRPARAPYGCTRYGDPAGSGRGLRLQPLPLEVVPLQHVSKLFGGFGRQVALGARRHLARGRHEGGKFVGVERDLKRGGAYLSRRSCQSEEGEFGDVSAAEIRK